jgi:hypothetical protein
VRGRASVESLDLFRPGFQPRLAPRANSQVLRAIGQKQASYVERELPNLLFRVTSEVSFLEGGVNRLDLERIRFALCDHVVKLDVSHPSVPSRVCHLSPKDLLSQRWH